MTPCNDYSLSGKKRIDKTEIIADIRNNLSNEVMCYSCHWDWRRTPELLMMNRWPAVKKKLQLGLLVELSTHHELYRADRACTSHNVILFPLSCLTVNLSDDAEQQKMKCYENRWVPVVPLSFPKLIMKPSYAGQRLLRLNNRILSCPSNSLTNCRHVNSRYLTCGFLLAS